MVVKAFILGKPTEIVMDDYLPFYKNSKSLMYAGVSSLKGGLWGPFIEKAYAKVNVNYEYIVGGYL